MVKSMFRKLPTEFELREKEVAVTEFRRRPRASVYSYIDVLGHIVFITRRGKRLCAIMSIETHAWLTGNYEKAMAEFCAAKEEYDRRKAQEKSDEKVLYN